MRNTGSLKVTTPTDREIVLTRVFNAPRHLVWEAFTKPELLKRWFGPRDWSLVVCEVDLKVGGGFRFVLRGPDGRDMGMRGTYREIVPGERSIHTEAFDDFPGESIVTTVLVENGGHDNAHGYGALPLAGSSRRCHPIRYGARRRGELRQACGVVGKPEGDETMRITTKQGLISFTALGLLGRRTHVQPRQPQVGWDQQ
jgi:uncharacterized protein YndB with AHSA1/START domain